MEDDEGNGSSSSSSSSRWNPTKEQISLLEGLYRQGLRTPTADQIQHITANLRIHGHIEAKNVFYWFQNHKARQRHKHKRNNLHHFPPLHNHPGFRLGLYPNVQQPTAGVLPRYNHSMHYQNGEEQHNHHQQTLDLFPIHPTGIRSSFVDGSNETNSDNHNYVFFDFFCRD